MPPNETDKALRAIAAELHQVNQTLKQINKNLVLLNDSTSALLAETKKGEN